MTNISNQFIDISLDKEDLKELIEALEETGRYEIADKLKEKLEDEEE